MPDAKKGDHEKFAKHIAGQVDPISRLKKLDPSKHKKKAYFVSKSTREKTDHLPKP